MEWEEWDGMTKLRRARRGVWGFEEVSLVIVDGLDAEFVKEARHPNLPIANSDWEPLVADC